MAMSHAPGLMSLPDAIPQDQQDELTRGFARLRETLEEAQPDVLIAFVNDHFENFFGALMPAFTVSTGGEHFGPPRHYEKWLGMERRSIPAARDYAKDVLTTTLERGFDTAQMDAPYEFGHNLVAPLLAVRPEFDIPVVPIVTNVFTPPLAPPWRSYDLGLAVREVIERRPERVALIATGALSHWPPFWYEDSPEDDAFLQRMRRFQTGGLGVLEQDPNLWVDLGIREEEMAASDMRLINPEWDRAVLAALERGDHRWFRDLDHDEIEEHGGNGGHEIRNWISLVAAMGDHQAHALAYVEAAEWMCGMGLVSYECVAAGDAAEVTVR
jgi:2,3-dihydroxyphenylpropionate 1,2-dioxygenase